MSSHNFEIKCISSLSNGAQVTDFHTVPSGNISMRGPWQLPVGMPKRQMEPGETQGMPNLACREKDWITPQRDGCNLDVSCFSMVSFNSFNACFLRWVVKKNKLDTLGSPRLSYVQTWEVQCCRRPNSHKMGPIWSSKSSTKHQPHIGQNWSNECVWK